MVAEMVVAYPRLDMVRRSRAYNTVPTIPGTFGDFIRRCREDVLGLSQDDFAALVGDGMSGTDVSQLERSKVGLPKPPRMIALARAVGLPVCDLYVAAGYPEFREQLGDGRVSIDNDPDLLAALLAFRQLEPERRRSYIRIIREDLKGTTTQKQSDRADESAASA